MRTIEEIFKALDKDNSGTIELEELLKQAQPADKEGE